jgi:lambda family phage tail tape measure protein
MAVIGSLSVKLGLVTVEWDKATAKAKQDAKQLQNAFNDLGGGVKTLSGYFKALGGSLGVASIGVGALLQQTIAFSGEIKDTANAFGISVAKVLQFRDALQTSGKSAQDAQKIMGKLFATIEEAREGNESTISKFNELGISFDELRRMSPEQALNRVFQALAGIDSQYKKIKATKDLLGKAGLGLNTEEVAQKLGMSLEEFRKYEDGLKRFGEVSDQLKTTMDNLKIAFADLAKPFAGNFVISVEKLKLAMVGLGSYAVVTGITTVAIAVGKLVMALRAGAVASAVMSGGLTTIAGLAGAGGLTALFAYMDKDENGEPISEPVTVTAKAESRAGGGERPELVALRKKLEYLKEIGKLNVQEIYAKDAMKNMAEFEKSMAEIQLDTEKKRLDIEHRRSEELKSNKDKESLHGGINAVYDQEIRNLDMLAEARRRVAEQNEANRQSFTYGWGEAFRKFADDAKDSAKVAGDMFNSITSNMNSAIDNFVRNGKLSFKDFTKSVIQDLIAIQLKSQAMQMFSGIGSIFGSMGTAMQYGTNVGSQQTMMLQAQGFADGGSPPVGVPSIVGERGAELFIPKQAGTIIPNNQLSSVLGTGTTINYNAPVVENLSAIDTQSGMQFLMKNKESIWSANQSASRSLPASR